MSEVLGTLSVSTLQFFKLRGYQPPEILKHYYILFDYICYSSSSSSEDFFERNNLANWASTDYREADKLFKNKNFSSPIICPNDILKPTRKKELASKYYSEDLINKIAGRYLGYCLGFDNNKFDMMDVESLDDDRKTACVTAAARDFAHYELLREAYPLTFSLFSEIHLAFYNLFKGSSASNLLDIEHIKNCKILPSFSSFSWNEILELRNDTYAKSFRKFIADYLLTNEHKTNKSIDSDLSNLLWDLVSSAKPTLKKTMYDLLVTTVSMVPFLSFISPIQYLIDKWRARDDFGVLFFIENVNSRLGKGNESLSENNVILSD